MDKTKTNVLASVLYALESFYICLITGKSVVPFLPLYGHILFNSKDFRDLKDLPAECFKIMYGEGNCFNDILIKNNVKEDNIDGLLRVIGSQDFRAISPQGCFRLDC